MWKSLILILIISLSLYAQETNPKQTKKYNIKTKGFKLTEIDEEGTPINVGKRYALVIGINDYNDSTISDLSKARNDAKAMGKILKELGQFDQVFVMTDDILKNDLNHLYPTKLNIEEKVESILRFITPEDMIVLYFSGHGISDFDENGYLLTVDTVADKKFTTSLKIDWIVKKFQEKKIKKSLLILDACRDILYTSKSAVRDSIREKIYTEAEVAATFYSTKSGYFSYEDDESDYGVFTKNLIYGMEGKADENNEKIRRVTSSGDVTTFAGSGSYAYTEGLAASAAFRSPLGVAIDTSGNLYIADSNNHRIRKISSGTVSTLAGSGSSGSTDANGTSASFNTPSGIAIDTSGNLYVADTINNKIRKVTSGGIVSSIGGAVFSNPLGVAVDSLGNIYIADTNNNKIKMMTQAGVVTTIGGTGDSGFLDGPALSALFNRPSGVAVDSNGNVYIADTSNNKIRMITSSGIATTLVDYATITNVSSTISATFTPYGISIDTARKVYFTDKANNRVFTFTIL